MTTLKDYQKFVSKGNVLTNRSELLVNSAFGICGESGEIVDIIKKQLHSGVLDIDHLTEEIGDLLWYMMQTCNLFDINFQSVIESNMKKLKKRYGDLYD